MFNIAFFKSQPTEFVIKYVNGKVQRSGPGMAFYYLKYNTQLVVVPTSTRDADFVFNELTGNFQAITVQGQFTFRIYDPLKAATLSGAGPRSQTDGRERRQDREPDHHDRNAGFPAW